MIRHNYILEINIYGNRDEYLIRKGTIMEWARHFRKICNTCYFYKIIKLPTIKQD